MARGLEPYGLPNEGIWCPTCGDHAAIDACPIEARKIGMCVQCGGTFAKSRTTMIDSIAGWVEVCQNCIDDAG